MTRKSYVEKLKDPRWQKMRLKVMERDGFRCAICGDDTKMLAAHHRWYGQIKDEETGNIRNRHPWEYDIKDLVTICSDCHESEHQYIEEYSKDIISLLKQMNFNFSDFSDLYGIFVMADYNGVQKEDLLNTMKETVNILINTIYSEE